MFDFQQKRKFKALTQSRITWSILLVITVFLFISVYDRYLIARDMAERRAEVESDLADLETRRTELSAEVQYLSNERGIEAEMRRQFDIARDGEQVVIIVEEEPENAPDALATTTLPSRAWYRFW
jgi:cell division protein FtsB